MLSASSSGSSDTTDTAKSGSEKKRRWAICVAKVKAGALRGKTFVTSSDSESSNSSSESAHESEGGSDRASDLGARDCGSRPHPLKVRCRRPHPESRSIYSLVHFRAVVFAGNITPSFLRATSKIRLYATSLCLEYRETLSPGALRATSCGFCCSLGQHQNGRCFLVTSRTD